MPRLSKRRKAIDAWIGEVRSYSVLEALKCLSEVSEKVFPRKFKESVEVHIKLGIDPKKHMVRKSIVLPHGVGRTVKVAVLAQGTQAQEAKEAGATRVGYEDLVEAIQAGDLDFDVLISTPESMSMLTKLGPILGPRGLMPNPKLGTVTNEVSLAVRNACTGQVQCRVDKTGVIHSIIGKVNFEAEKLRENLEVLLVELKKEKPIGVKRYFEKITLSSTMGPGLTVEQTSLSAVL